MAPIRPALRDLRRGLRAAFSAAALAVLSSCGGGVDVVFWWGDEVCATLPPLVSVPPSTATAGQPYLATLVFDSTGDCAVGACFDLLALRLPPGAVFDAATQRILWTPTAVQVGTIVVFEIAAVTRDCGRQTAWTWTVRVLA